MVNGDQEYKVTWDAPYAQNLEPYSNIPEDLI